MMVMMMMMMMMMMMCVSPVVSVAINGSMDQSTLMQSVACVQVAAPSDLFMALLAANSTLGLSKGFYDPNAVSPPACLFVRLFVCLSVRLSVCQLFSVYSEGFNDPKDVSPFVCLYVCLYICSSVCLSVCLLVFFCL